MIMHLQPKPLMIVQFDWLKGMNENLYWHDEYHKLMEQFTLNDIIQYLLERPIYPAQIELSDDMNDWLLSHFPIEDLNDNTLNWYRNFTCDVLCDVSRKVYGNLYEMMHEHLGEYKFIKWMDHDSVLMRYMGTLYWGE